MAAVSSFELKGGELRKKFSALFLFKRSRLPVIFYTGVQDMNKNRSTDTYRSMRISMNEDAMYKGEKLYRALVLELKKLGVPEVTVTHGIDGYGSWNRREGKDSQTGVPVLVEAIDQSWQISNIMWKIEDMVAGCLVTTSDIVVVRYSDTAAPL